MKSEWLQSEKYGVFMLLWMILGTNLTGGLALIAYGMGMFYSSLSMFNYYKECKVKRGIN